MPDELIQSNEPGRSVRGALVVMAKVPVPGTVKTRLCPPLTPEVAAELYGAFLRDVLVTMGRVRGVRTFLFLAGGAPERDWPGWQIRPQEGATLGERMHHCFRELLGEGHPWVLMRNSDSPTMPVQLVEQARQEISREDVHVVLAPDPGGGYGLIGLKAPQPELFTPEVMARPRMFEATVEAAVNLGLGVRLVEACLDVDLPSDLVLLRRELARPEVAARCPRTAEVLSGIPLP